MADTTEKTTTQPTDERAQSSFDNSFFEQMGGSTSAGYDVTSQVVQSYFDQVEATTRQARRMADLWAQSLILKQTTSQIAQVIAPVVKRQVIEQLKNDPAWARQLADANRR